MGFLDYHGVLLCFIYYLHYFQQYYFIKVRYKKEP